ncbi:MAG: branched-chain amino acid ABC transporter permease [Rhodospirillaceae bacterium]|nr:branched-chain amino acid ABC transporter permease [Rhodospirillaceae bacterium]MYB15086.1 branched-chain amino acid ABC transporter permease [Rhodospirillaceae bacterium]MYG53237.1 branched-chain amino acid ABC transporter permease [Rhodospirillaceae bacterium]MYI50212.1 branched-chain amino acid ABC transporter permease [Rhodospirillaceae bacterium]
MAGHGNSNLNPRIRLSFADPRFVIMVIGLIGLAVLPIIAAEADDVFMISFMAKMMIFAIAAASLDLILGYGGMISFGHAAYIGLGSYAVAVSARYFSDLCVDVEEGQACAYGFLASGYFQFAVAVVGSALVALVIGAISLRTTGLYFIMITLAFTQMLFFLGISLEPFGGDDGMTLDEFSDFAVFAIGDDVFYDGDGATLYYLCFGALLLSLLLLRRLVNSRFGMVIRGGYSNPVRMAALGYPVYRYRLTAFVIAGTICGVAGALFANHQEFLTPEYMMWIRSGEIMIMVIMGGMGTIFGPVFGALAFLSIEEFLQELVGQEYWMIVFGPMLVLLVLFAKRGLFGLIPDNWAAMPRFAVGFVLVAAAAAVFLFLITLATPFTIVAAFILLALAFKLGVDYAGWPNPLKRLAALAGGRRDG